MKYCRHCGNEVDDDALFCPNCGSKINGSSSEDTYTSDSHRSYSSRPRAHKMRETDGGAAGFGILGFFVPIVGLILFIAWKDSGPRYSKAAGIGALIGVVIQTGFSFSNVFGHFFTLLSIGLF